MRTTGTILGRNPTPPMMGARMGMNPAFSPRATHPHIPARVDRSDKSYKSPLQPQHFDNLKSADEWPVWERRVRSHLRSIPGYGEQLDVGYESLIDSVKQEEILNFLIQKVHDPNGFDKLLTVEGEALTPCEVSSRGRRAWHLLKEHYEQVGTYRLHDLMSDFMRPQQPTESGSAYITRVINRRQEICQSGTPISVEQVKAALMEGLRKEYQPYISDFHISTHDIGTLRSKLIGTCNRVERQMQKETTSQHMSAHMSAHFGSAYDALGYQQPPRTIRGRPPAPAHTTILKGVIDDLRAHLSADLNITDDAYDIVESALMAATTANRICYYCQQHGHIASTCPLKQQHR